MAVVDNAGAHRFEVHDGGHLAELTYKVRGEGGKELVLIHTGVPDELGGRGIAGELVGAAVERARSEGLTIVPHCSYARSWLEKHPERTEGVTIDWDG
jgi:hypothetical protein